MPVVKNDMDDPWKIKELMRSKLISKLEGQSIADPKVWVESEEGQKLIEETKSEVESFLGYSLEESQKNNMLESLAAEIKWASKKDDGESELACDDPSSIID